MFESSERLAGEIGDLLDAIRGAAGSRYACLLEPKAIVFERAEPDFREAWALKRFLEQRSAALFEIPASLASGEAMEDVFAGWDEDEFFLAFINGRVALVVACAEAESARDRSMETLRALADRLLRYNERYRMDEKGRGFFVGRPRLDLVVIGRPTG